MGIFFGAGINFEKDRNLLFEFGMEWWNRDMSWVLGKTHIMHKCKKSIEQFMLEQMYAARHAFAFFV